MSSWITLNAAKAFLQFDMTSTADDAVLGTIVDGACGLIEDVKGRIGPDPIVAEAQPVERLGLVFLTETPIVSVQSVTYVRGVGDTVDVPADDPVAGVAGYKITSLGGVLAMPCSVPQGATVLVNYTAGRDPIPPNWIDAALELTAHLWRSSQDNTSGNVPDASGYDAEVIRGTAYAFPFRVRELLGIFGKVVKSTVLVR